MLVVPVVELVASDQASGHEGDLGRHKEDGRRVFHDATYRSLFRESSLHALSSADPVILRFKRTALLMPSPTEEARRCAHSRHSISAWRDRERKWSRRSHVGWCYISFHEIAESIAGSSRPRTVEHIVEDPGAGPMLIPSFGAGVARTLRHHDIHRPPATGSR
jgi:hypothetical protein